MKYPNFRLFLCLVALTGSIFISGSPLNHTSFPPVKSPAAGFHNIPQDTVSIPDEITQLTASLKIMLTIGELERSRLVVGSIINEIDENIITDKKSLSEPYYFIGVYYILSKNYFESVKFLGLSVAIKESEKEFDIIYAKALYNLGVAYYGLGDISMHEYYSLKSLESEKRIFGESSPDLLETYLSLIIAYIELQENEKAIDYSNIALAIANKNSDRLSPVIMADLYYNLGVCYNRLADFSKAKIYLDKVESIYKQNGLYQVDRYINLMNSLGIAYRALRLAERSDEFYNKGISLAVANNSSLAFNLVNSYAIILGNSGKEDKGEELLTVALSGAFTQFGEDSRNYIEVLNNYASYLREYKIDIKKSLESYVRCMNYLRKNDKDIFLKTSVHIGYSLSLTEAGELDKALEIVQLLLFSGKEQKQAYTPLDNPGIEFIKIDMKSLRILRTKYLILWDIYRKSHDQNVLEAASNTSELIVSLLEKIRINISEEESRLVLGDQYRGSYLNAIRDFNLLYSKSENRQFLEKAFEYSEKSKVAGLLTSTRELKATQFHIPSDIADSEKKLQRNISLLNARIADETVKVVPDTILINKWKENLFEATRIRDSLVSVFEIQYPDYYAIKYNTHVSGYKDIQKITGRRGNYISYVVSDTLLYIFIVNRKHQELLSLPVDSAFINNIKLFRSLLSAPSPSDNALIAFEKYQSTGYELYKILLDPVRPFLISDKILLSPDNILSYLPFETIPVASDSGERLIYRDLSFLMNYFDISYTYSATLLAESVKRDFFTPNKVIAFAPDYPEPVDIQSLILNRQTQMGMLSDLPYARQEAEYVSNITGGKLFVNKAAKESVYKAESGKYAIIHLAMHTILNDTDPMHSTLIFSPENDTIEDRYLKTYEVYGIPLKAKMVVLSSCNTGLGLLYSGEGILSLARGFIYSGSQSVVMSMWEIEDRSGTEIVKMFYRNLKKGYSKSVALKKARISYLKKADQLRSHPYFWSALVVYGNNAPLYYPKYPVIGISIFIIGALAIYYFRKRKYS